MPACLGSRSLAVGTLQREDGPAAAARGVDAAGQQERRSQRRGGRGSRGPAAKARGRKAQGCASSRRRQRPRVPAALPGGHGAGAAAGAKQAQALRAHDDGPLQPRGLPCAGFDLCRLGQGLATPSLGGLAGRPRLGQEGRARPERGPQPGLARPRPAALPPGRPPRTDPCAHGAGTLAAALLRRSRRVAGDALAGDLDAEGEGAGGRQEHGGQGLDLALAALSTVGPDRLAEDAQRPGQSGQQLETVRGRGGYGYACSREAHVLASAGPGGLGLPDVALRVPGERPGPGNRARADEAHPET
mmetsp:Transcript_74176/g.229288  ORF Transcript_74176/g.229288 Transcript_74176/m.229288 type:complete len:302 (-) Transcript_74176:193-1098(-)